MGRTRVGSIGRPLGEARRSLKPWWSTVFVERTWPLALFVAFLVVGPVLLPGMVLNLDLVLVPELDVPSGFWGLGPELPRRLPLWVPVSLLSSFIPATLLGKAMLVGQIVLGWTGMSRLVRSMGPLDAHVVGALYVLGPFMATRAVVGHFMITIPLAVLPWVLPILARPGRSIGSTMLAASALGFGGHFGGSIALVVVVLALVFGDRHRWGAVLGVTVLGQAAWLLPGVAVWFATRPDASTATVFGTIVDSPADVLRVFVGGGFWNSYFQTGGTGMAGAVTGAIVILLALAGSSRLPSDTRRLTEGLAIVGWVVTMWSGLPLVAGWFDSLTSNPVFAVWRESHRLFALTWFWLVPSAVAGARRLAGRAADAGRSTASGAIGAIPVSVLLILAVPSLWAYGGRLEAMPVPDGWNEARQLVRSQPGTVIALPWRQYFNLQIGTSDVHRVLHPLPLFLGGDVITSSDNQLGTEVRERGDPREAWLDPVLERLENGGRVGPDLGAAGVRWIVVLETVHAERYRSLYHDPEVELVLDADEVDVFAVRSWSAAALGANGRPVETTTVGPVTLIDDEAVTWFAPAGPGWRRGWSATAASDQGTVVLEPGARVVWNVATLPALVGQIGQLLVVSALLFRRIRYLPYARRIGSLTELGRRSGTGI